jgi:hypothetical protein
MEGGLNVAHGEGHGDGGRDLNDAFRAGRWTVKITHNNISEYENTHTPIVRQAIQLIAFFIAPFNYSVLSDRARDFCHSPWAFTVFYTRLRRTI